MPERSAISRRECSPSERFRTHKKAMLFFARVFLATNHRIETAPSKLRLTFRLCIQKSLVSFDYLNYADDSVVRRL